MSLHEYLLFVYKVSVWFRMFANGACDRVPHAAAEALTEAQVRKSGFYLRK